MRTLSTSTRTRRSRTRISARGLAVAAVPALALALTACGGSSGTSGAAKGNTSTAKGGGPVPGSQSSPSSTPSPSQGFDPAAGPTVDAKDLPKTCSGLVTDADMQLALGNPLNGGDFFTAYQPDAGHKQTGRVKCQYGVVLDNSGKITSDQVDVQLATYADAASAQSRAAATVGTLAGGGAQYAQVSVGGHPATYVTEAGKDAELVMYDGNRTFLITVQEALVKGEDAKAFAMKICAALYKHTTPNSSQIPTGGASSGASGSAPASSGAAPSGASGSAPPANPAPSTPSKS